MAIYIYILTSEFTFCQFELIFIPFLWYIVSVDLYRPSCLVIGGLGEPNR